MLTPMDIQQKRFHVGIGFDKKDVTTFFESVSESYEQLYRSNAELKERVTSLEDILQNYKSKEASLEKTIMLAEKDSEDKKSKASKEAKSIELDAKNKAKIIIGDAEERLKEVEAQIEMLKTQYASYKSSLASLLKMHLTHLKEEDFDVDSYIDPRFAGVFMGGGVPAAPSGGGAGFEYNGDPQMRDESTLGGASGGYGMSMSAEAKATSSEVYTSLMKDNENFVDPFNTDKVQNGRYNPYDGRTEKKEKKTGQTTFTVAGANKNRNRAKTNQINQSQNAQHNKQSYSGSTKNDKTDTPKSEFKAQSPSPEELKRKKEEEILAELKAMRAAAEKAKAAEEAKATEEAKVAEETKASKDESYIKEENNEETNAAREKAKEFFKKAASSKSEEEDKTEGMEDEFVGEVEDSDKVGGKLLIGDDNEAGEDADEDGFEFF